MNSYFNLDGYKIWNKSSVKPNENTNYVAYHNSEKNSRCILFNSGSDMVNCLEDNFKSGVWDKTNSGAATLETKDWERNDWTFGKEFSTLAETREALQGGTTAVKFLKLVDSVREDIMNRFPEIRELSDVAPVKRRRRRFSEDADELDIDRYMCGDPACFSSLPRQDVKKKSARVYIDYCVCAGTSTETLTKNIIFALVMCDIIERAGINMEIIMGTTSKNTLRDFSGILNVSCVAKRADEPMDIMKLLSFALPGFYRHYTFGTFHYTSDKGGNYGLGYPVSNTNDDFFKMFNADIVYRGEDPYWNPGAANMWVNGVKELFNLEKIGV